MLFTVDEFRKFKDDMGNFTTLIEDKGIVMFIQRRSSLTPK
jgi:hypothetical protein